MKISKNFKILRIVLKQYPIIPILSTISFFVGATIGYAFLGIYFRLIAMTILGIFTILGSIIIIIGFIFAIYFLLEEYIEGFIDDLKENVEYAKQIVEEKE